jgi:hypothetical protein
VGAQTDGGGVGDREVAAKFGPRTRNYWVAATRPQYAHSMMRRSLRNLRGPGRLRTRAPGWVPVLVAAVVAGVTAVVGVAALVISGGSAPSNPPPRPPTEAEIVDAMVTYVDEQAAHRSGVHPEIWEQVKFETFATEDDAPLVLSACLSDFGVTGVEVGDGGSMSWTNSSGRGLQSAGVDACSLMYPFEYIKATVRTDAQLSEIYRYVTAFLVPCLQGQGLEPEEPPALDEFRSAAHRDLRWWNPYDTLDYRGVMWPNYDSDPTAYDLRVNELIAQCPPTGDGL